MDEMLIQYRSPPEYAAPLPLRLRPLIPTFPFISFRINYSLIPFVIALSLELMLCYGIAKFIGSWVSASGYFLRIKKMRKDQASVDFLDPGGAPVQRSYMGGNPSMNMVAHYDEYYEDFEVELWEERRFILHLSHEYDYELDPKHREALVPGLSRLEGDRFLDEYYSLFGPLDHFVRREGPAPTNRAPIKTSE